MLVPIVVVSRTLEDLLPSTFDFVMQSGQPFVHYVKGSLPYHPEPAKNTLINIAKNRTAGLRHAMKYTGAEHFFFLDSDVVPPAGAIEILLSRGKDVISGWIPRRGGGWVSGLFPLPYAYAPFSMVQSGLTETHMVTLGATLVSRKCLEGYYFGPGIDTVVRCTDDGTIRMVGDGGQFSREMMENGKTLYLDGDVVCQHLERKP